MYTGCAYVAIPTFKLTTDRPHDFNATVGDDVVFQCNAYAIPEASVVWYKNGEPIDRKPKNLVKMYSISVLCCAIIIAVIYRISISV